MKATSKEKKARRHRRIRAVLKGTKDRPRLSVFHSHRHVWLQLIDDNAARTIVAVGDMELAAGKTKKERNLLELAVKTGELLAKKALAKRIKQIVFDRGGYKYHGIVKAIAEGARKGGLIF